MSVDDLTAAGGKHTALRDNKFEMTFELCATEHRHRRTHLFLAFEGTLSHQSLLRHDVLLYKVLLISVAQ